MIAVLLLALLFYLAAHGFGFLTWVLAAVILVGWVQRRLARIRWFRWWIRNAPR